jgi:glycosyltransferase involved in cell wall biosynthesis
LAQTNGIESFRYGMKITVILCTYNRSSLLAQALESILASTLPTGVEWEIFVVDNNSTDRTRAVAARFCDRYPDRCRYLFESRQGKSHALNAAIRESRADIVAFTDDDVTVEPNWLQNLTAPLTDSGWAGSAGRIRIGQDFSPPHWLATSGAFNLGASLVQFDQGDEQKSLDTAPFGANMAFRKTIFDKYGAFRTDLGPSGKGQIRNEDTEFGERLLAAGERLCYVPSAVVNHPVQKERLQKKYFRSYYFAHGRASARQAGQRLPIWRVPRYCLGGFKRKLRWMASLNRRWFLRPQGRFFYEVHTLRTFGEILESCRNCRTGRP